MSSTSKVWGLGSAWRWVALGFLSLGGAAACSGGQEPIGAALSPGGLEQALTGAEPGLEGIDAGAGGADAGCAEGTLADAGGVGCLQAASAAESEPPSGAVASPAPQPQSVGSAAERSGAAGAAPRPSAEAAPVPLEGAPGSASSARSSATAALGQDPVITAAKPGPVAEACEEGFYPTHQSAFGDRVCAEGRPCADNAAWDFGGAGAAGSCRTCPRCFGEEQGGTGRPYPYRDRDGQCVCESQPGFFATPGLGSGLSPCDADGDGWVRQSAERFVAPTESQMDAAHQLNARCEVRQVDTVFLVNEYNQGLEVPISEPSLGLERNVLDLYEPDDNDSSELFEDCEGSSSCRPHYGARSLQANEVNGFTKACLTPEGDFNANGVPDVLENEQSVVPVASLKPFTMFSHYLELHDSEYQPPEEGARFGTYVIRERSRCQATFPLNYETAETEYWRQCTRRRPPAFQLGESTAATGFDFGRFSCDSSEGGCPAPLPPAKGFGGGAGTPFVLEPGEVDPAQGEAVEHGLCIEPERPFQLCQLDGGCTVEGSRVPGLAWRGMQHHSQFRCALLADVDEGRAAIAPEQVAPWGGETATYEANECGLLAPSEAGGTNPSLAPVACSPTPAMAPRPAVSWVARRYMGEPGYNEGCVNEALEPNFLKLCPGGETAGASTSLRPFGSPDRFGLLLCGCDPEVGGAACDVGCPGDRVHFGGAANQETCVDDSYLVNGYCALTREGRREGVWLCGDTAASVTESSTGALEPFQEAHVGETTFRLSGGIPTMPVVDTPLQGALGCDEQTPCPFGVLCNNGTCNITVRADSNVGG